MVMPLNVLVVDDTAFMRLMLKNILIQNGCNIIGEASDGDEAIRKCHELEPDVVFMDITMPNVDGITATREILKHYPETKIIICSAMGQKSMVLEALELGATDFIVKPFEADRVLQSLTKLGRSTN
jgi:two-component system chemotaxis response regulator CheY